MTSSRLSEKDQRLLAALGQRNISPLDLLPHRDMKEKLVDLVLNGVPAAVTSGSAPLLTELRERMRGVDTDDVKVVVFGGGTGLSNIIGGDSRQKNWLDNPFEGLKNVFPKTRAVVCVTDDGGSTGELLKDLPIIGIGDIRHVMLSSIQGFLLEKAYGIPTGQAVTMVRAISRVFNYRFSDVPESSLSLLSRCVEDEAILPEKLRNRFVELIDFCIKDPQCSRTLGRSHCLGNLLIAAAIRGVVGDDVIVGDRFVIDERNAASVYRAISDVGELIGTGRDATLPCTLVPAQLRFRYGDGVEVTGENKSGVAERGAAVAGVTVDFSGRPQVNQALLELVRTADILIMAPGSLYSSIIPVMQVPGIAEAVRENQQALKLLIANLWVQQGETDKAIGDPDRKFHVSDMIRAYEQNLPGGVSGLFDQILCLSMQDLPASVIQNYAVEGKNPIYLDRELLKKKGFEPVECGFFSKSSLIERGVIQHDPEVVAQTVKTLFVCKELDDMQAFGSKQIRPAARNVPLDQARLVPIPSIKCSQVQDRLGQIVIDSDFNGEIRTRETEVISILSEILWSHQDIPLSHLDYFEGICFISEKNWRRDQRWDNVFSFFDPDDRVIKIREDRLRKRSNLEVSFLIALGQALLGDYASTKIITPLLYENKEIGAVYHLSLKEVELRTGYFDDDELRHYLKLSRMVEQSPTHFTRTINGSEGFTPPGLLMGLLYAWYLDNRFASHIEYKMSIMKIRPTQLIPEQKKMRTRREELIDFFRDVVFGKEAVPLDLE